MKGPINRDTFKAYPLNRDRPIHSSHPVRPLFKPILHLRPSLGFLSRRVEVGSKVLSPSAEMVKERKNDRVRSDPSLFLGPQHSVFNFRSILGMFVSSICLFLVILSQAICPREDPRIQEVRCYPPRHLFNYSICFPLFNFFFSLFGLIYGGIDALGRSRTNMRTPRWCRSRG